MIRSTLALSTALLCGCVAVASPPSGRAARGGLDPEALTALDSLLQSYVADGRLAGVTAAIALDGRTLHEVSVGRMDLETQRPLRADAVFRIYSMTKPVLGAAAMVLVEQGRLSLEDPVARYIPAFAAVRVYAGGPAVSPTLVEPDSIMRVRHLLTHTAGLGYGIGNEPVDTLYQQAAVFDPARTLEQFADSVAQLPLYSSPGRAFRYSAAIDVLGRVIEVASGLPLDRFLYEALFVPLDMRDTSFRIRPDMADRMVALYARDAAGTLAEVTGGLGAMYEPDARFLWGGGGLLSTTRDYLRFAQMLLDGGVVDGRRVLSASSVATMLRNHLPASLTPLDSRPPMIDGGYGYGLAGAVLVDSTLAALPGPAGIYRWSGYVGTYFWIDPVNRLTAMVWTQFTPGRTYPLEQEFQRLVYDALTP